MFGQFRGPTVYFKPQKFSNIVQAFRFAKIPRTSLLLHTRKHGDSKSGTPMAVAMGCISSSSTLESLKFDNLALRSLPIDPERENFIRQVPGACFSLVKPTPVKDPELVVYSESAMSLLDLPKEQVETAEFVEYFSGNKRLPGSKTAAHCYCGHQFGSFAGQLGDGAAIYLGEVVNHSGERWEIQLKGAGKTPFSRTADGRKVLRSSIREFLCSEAMHYLGIPTTRGFESNQFYLVHCGSNEVFGGTVRKDIEKLTVGKRTAGCCITSDTKVIRDIFYNGNPIYEKSSIVLRIAPTFIRFGSFEIVKPRDPMTGRRGPSAGQTLILIQLLDYVIETFYPQVHGAHRDNSEERYLAFYKEVVMKTARTVAEWQCVGFCHGVLNTDNMSILGLTIDYGPFGFMDHFNPNYVCNDSDNMARYSYKAQPEICKWNLIKLAEAIAEVLPFAKSRALLEDKYDLEFMDCYLTKMRRKLGIMHTAVASDRTLVEELLQTMKDTGADFTNVFRCLSKIIIHRSADSEKNNEEVLEYILSQCLDSSDFPEELAGSEQLQLLLLMMNTNPALAAQFAGNPIIQAEKERMERAKKMKEVTPEEKHSKDKVSWALWIEKYRKRIEEDFAGHTDKQHLLDKARVDLMNRNNPRVVLRNYIAENAIKAAENGDYTIVQHVLSVLRSPYADDLTTSFEVQSDRARCSSNPDNFTFDHKPPRWAHELRVT